MIQATISRESRFALEKRKSQVDIVQDMKNACDTFLRDQRKPSAVKAWFRALGEAKARMEGVK